MFAAHNAFFSSAVKAGPPTIKSFAESSATSESMPTHATGDLLIIAALADSPASVSMPGGWTDFGFSGAVSGGYSLMAGWKYAASSSETTGTWSNASRLVMVVVTGAKTSSPFGGTAGAPGSYYYPPYMPAVTLTKTDGSSLLLQFSTQRNATTYTWPAGYTKHTQLTYSAIGYKNVSTSDGTFNLTVSGNSYNIGVQMEILSP